MEGTPRLVSHTLKSIDLLDNHVFGRNPNFMIAAVNFGRELVTCQIRLAYGGGCIGLQGGVDSTISKDGGPIKGFIPAHIAVRGAYSRTYGVEHHVPSNDSKSYAMNHVVEAFIALPGGVDTIEGLFTLISWVSEKLIYKPISLLNVDGYFNNLLKFLDEAVRQNFMDVSQGRLFISFVLIDWLLNKLKFAKTLPGADYKRSINPEGLDLEFHL